MKKTHMVILAILACAGVATAPYVFEAYQVSRDMNRLAEIRKGGWYSPGPITPYDRVRISKRDLVLLKCDTEFSARGMRGGRDGLEGRSYWVHKSLTSKDLSIYPPYGVSLMRERGETESRIERITIVVPTNDHLAPVAEVVQYCRETQRKSK